MALVSIKNGTVSRLNASGRGFTVVEQNESNGKTYRSFYKVWPTEDAGVSVGDIVNVSGFLSVKVNEPNQEGKVYADVSLNSPRIERVGSQPPQQSPPVASGSPRTAPNTAPSTANPSGVWHAPQNDAQDELPW